MLARRCVGGVRVGVVCGCVCGGGCLVQHRQRKGCVFVRGVLVSVLFAVCCLLCGFGCVARASHLAHTLTHVGTVFDGGGLSE